MRRVVLLVAACLAGGAAAPADTFTVQSAPIADEKAVFATIESPNVVPARAHRRHRRQPVGDMGRCG